MATTKFTAQNLDPNATASNGVLSWVPTVKAGGLVLGSSIVTASRYRTENGLVYMYFELDIVTGGSYNDGSGRWYFSLPVDAVGQIQFSAHGTYYDASTFAFFHVTPWIDTNSQFYFSMNDNTAVCIGNGSIPVAHTTGDILKGWIIYPYI